MQPPQAPRRPQRLIQHGVERVDDYYWLRDDQREDAEVLAYLRAETEYAAHHLSARDDAEAVLFEELRSRIEEDDDSVPYLEGDYWYWTRERGALEHPIYMRRRDHPDAIEEVMLDVNDLAAGHGFFDVTGVTVSPDGRYLAFAEDPISRGEWTLRIRDLLDGTFLPERIVNTAGDMVWANDSSTLFYVKQQADTLIPDRVFRHRLGTDPDRDALVYRETDDSFFVMLDKSQDDAWIFIAAIATLSTECWYLPADRPDTSPAVVLQRQPGHEYDLDVIDEVAVILSNWNAENFRVLEVPLGQCTDQSRWREIIPHQPGVLLQDFAAFRSHLVLEELAEANTRLRIVDRRSLASFLVASAEPAFTAQIDENRGPDPSALRYAYSSLATPESIYDVDLATGQRALLKRQAVPDFAADDYRTLRVSATARDGTTIPVSLLTAAGAEPDGSQPLYVVGYGAYGLSNHPEFDADLLTLVDRGFVVALAHVRGGQEKGRRWYEAGRLHNKLNTFTDFIDVTESLLASGWGDRRRVVATGRSAGGLLMGAIANMRPDLYTVIVTEVPFVDVVTTMLDATIPLTTFEREEWGDPHNPEDFQFMLSYSPYDQVAAQQYPHMLVSTGLWDPAVQYWEPAKWVAKLRACKTGDSRLLLWVDMDAGHSGHSGRYESLKDTARELAFVFDVLGVKL